MKKIKNIHPGEILKEEFLKGFNISAYRLSKDTNMPPTRVSQIIKGKRGISADTALRLSKYFGTTANFWLGLQNEYNLREERVVKAKELSSIKRINIPANI